MVKLEAKKEKLLRDFLTNIIAAVIPIALLQLLIFPQIAKIKGDEIYGLIVTSVSVMTLFSDSWGNVLNNVRLLQDEKYKEKGDFNVILAIGAVFNLFAVCIGCYYYGLGREGIIGILVASILILARAYYIVAFRLILSYTNILINNAIMTLGYLVGFALFLKFDNWTIIYTLGNLFSLIHLKIKSNLMNEPLRKTELFRETIKKFSILYIADFLKTFITYADKLLIYPLLGAQAVAYYYAASVMGKMMSMAISPISSVILSYIVKAKSLSQKNKNKLLLLIGAIGIIGFGVTYAVGRILLRFLYSSWFGVTVRLLPWTVLAAILGGITSIIHPFILRFKNELYQIIVNVINIVTYIAISFVLSKAYGLVGFCIGYCVTMLIKLVVYLVLFESIGRTS